MATRMYHYRAEPELIGRAAAGVAMSEGIGQFGMSQLVRALLEYVADQRIEPEVLADYLNRAALEPGWPAREDLDA